MRTKEELQAAFGISDEEIAEMQEEDKKMMEALKAAPAPIYEAWKLADSILGEMTIADESPLHDKIYSICWYLSHYAEELAKQKRQEKSLQWMALCLAKRGGASPRSSK